MVKSRKKEKRTTVSRDAAAVLTSANQKMVQLRTELLVMSELTKRYMEKLKLNPAKNYQFIVEGSKTFAVEVKKSEIKEGGEVKENV